MRNLGHRWKKVIFVNFQKRAVKIFLPSPSQVDFDKWILKAPLYVYHTCANSYAITIAQNYFTTKLAFNSCNSVLSEVGGYSICEACFCNKTFGQCLLRCIVKAISMWGRFYYQVLSRIMMSGSSTTAKTMDQWRLKMFEKALNQHIVFMASSSSYLNSISI